jgi:hypothetical protein
MHPIPYDRYHIPGGATIERLGAALIVPFVPGMLKAETFAAIEQSGAPYFTFPLQWSDPYQYAELFRQLWDWPVDTVFIEQDMVPTTQQIKDLLYCNHDWCTIKYHQGGGMYTDGIGFAKFSAALKTAWPVAGSNISADPRGRERAVKWPSLNEQVENHLSRLGVVMHVHDGHVVHLHYPEPEHG